VSWIVYWLVRAMIAGVQALSLPNAARLGRFFGALAWTIDRKHRKIVLDNLRAALPELGPERTLLVGRENMMRIGESYASGIKTASMSVAEICRVCEVDGLENLQGIHRDRKSRNCVVAIGHFGNFEIYTLLGSLTTGMKPATTYRGLNHPRLDDILKSLRNRSGCRYFERRTEAKQLKKALNEGGLFLGLLADQHAGRGGVWAPFFGRECSTSTAPAVFALRYEAPLFTAICYRVGLGRWRLEVGPEIPTHENGSPRPISELARDMNEAFEHAIRRDPANWFWVHKRWKPRPKTDAAPLKPDAQPAGRAAEPASP
jgi:KDO2-lipid IV(A) lauroyltransferase